MALLLNLLGLAVAPPPPSQIPFTYALANRVVALLVLAATALLALGLLQWFRYSLDRQERMTEALRELDENQRLLRVAGEVGHLGGWSLSLPDMKLTWSDQMRAIYELPEGHEPNLEEALGYYVPEDRDRVRQQVEACISEGTPFDEELRVITARGRPIWVRAVGQAVRDPQGRIIGLEGALQDITGPKALQVSLTSSQERFRALANAMPLIVWTAEPDGQLDFFSHTLIDFTGLDPKELSRRNHWLKALHREDRARCLEAWRASMGSGETFSVQARVHSREGSYLWHLIQASPNHDAKGDIVKWYGSAMQIHEQVELEQETIDLSQRLRDTLESMSDAFFLLDDHWNFAYLNSTAEQLLRRKRWELIDRCVWDEFPEAVGSDFDTHYRLAMREMRTTHFRSYYPPLDTWFEVNAYPSPRGLAVYFQNITERLRLEDQARESQRLEALGQLTGGVAHDFNNLLTVILGNTELIQEQLATQPRLQALTRITLSAAQRGAELTQRLLAFARRQTLEPRVVDVGTLLEEMREMLQRTLGEQYPISLSLHPRLWRAQIDPGQLENALLNLCLNARDAMPGGDPLALEADNARLDEDYVRDHPDAVVGDYVRVSVSDTGQGIAPEHLHRVFEPFFTTKENGKGTGLGLSMVYGFIRQSRGHVNVYSELGMGTTLRLYLPRTSASPQTESAVATDVAESAQGGAEIILLVEDDELVRENAQAQLLSLGYQVIPTANAAEALVVIRSDTAIDLLFTDVIMPGGMNGRELAEAAREIRPGLRVLFTSGYTQDVILHQGRLDPGVQLLSKPYRRTDLARKIRESLRVQDHTYPDKET
ncbi:MAG TPA: PAS domain-containing protein, partial [Thioalkalivibrio sp.]|nr:PAS domain-containing protein [Thioalkalivibrio sp.]